MSGARTLLPTCAFVAWAGTLHYATVFCTQNAKQLMGFVEIISAYFKIHVRKAVWENEVFLTSKQVVPIITTAL
jgi:hypothetical protein